MPTRAALVDDVLAELIGVQGRPPTRPASSGRLWLPPMLPTGDGRSLPVSEKLLADVSRFAELAARDRPDLATSFTKKDLAGLFRKAFGLALTPLDLDDDIMVNRRKVLDCVENYVSAEMSRILPERILVVGCSFLKGSIPDVVIGPVRFEARERWLDRVRTGNVVSPVTARRLSANWAGRRVRKRRGADFEQVLEDELLRAIGPCPAVCTVQTRGLAGKALETKALLAARLGLTTIALLWPIPSKVLDGLNLLFDGGVHSQDYVLFAADGWRGSSSGISRLPAGPNVPPNWDDLATSSDWVFASVAEAILGYVEPGRAPARPRLSRALFMSLWWFHEACRERSTLLATVKFAASMDALAKGTRRRGITNLIEARLGMAPGSRLTTDGRTTDDVIGEVYDYARSRTIHGSNDRLGYDWTSTRDLAEALARLCIHEVCGWMHEHPLSDDIDALRVR